MTVGEGQAGRETWPRTPLRFRTWSSDAGVVRLLYVVHAEQLSAHFSPTMSTTTWSRRAFPRAVKVLRLALGS